MNYFKQIQKHYVKATGEMYQSDLEKGGDWEEARETLEDVCKKAGVKCEVKPFDTYQGPFAQLKNGKLWFGKNENQFVFEPTNGDKKVLNYAAMIKFLKPKLALVK